MMADASHENWKAHAIPILSTYHHAKRTGAMNIHDNTIIMLVSRSIGSLVVFYIILICMSIINLRFKQPMSDDCWPIHSNVWSAH